MLLNLDVHVAMIQGNKRSRSVNIRDPDLDPRKNTRNIREMWIKGTGDQKVIANKNKEDKGAEANTDRESRGTEAHKMKPKTSLFKISKKKSRENRNLLSI